MHSLFWRYTTLSILAGILFPFAFAPWNFYLLAFLTPALLLYVWMKSTPKEAFWQGLLFGIFTFGIGTYWVYISMHSFGAMSIFLSSAITALFILILALFPATQAYFFSQITHNRACTVSMLCFFPATWVLWEWLRSVLLTGFPWFLIGTAQVNSSFSGYAPLFGVYGISLLVVFSSSLITLAVFKKNFRTILSCLSVIGLFILGAFLQKISWTKAIHPTQQVSLVQGNIQQSVKWDSLQVEKTLATYLRLTKQHWNSHIIIWPEAAVPRLPESLPDFFNYLTQETIRHNTTLILGVPFYFAQTNQIFNGLMVVGQTKGVYLKRKLVPFGEYTPFQKLWAHLLDSLHIPMSDLTEGPKQQAPLNAHTIPLAAFICYEIAYPNYFLNYLGAAEFIVVLSDDSWFGKSSASAQQLQMAQLRAQESRRYILYSTNTGITAIIDPYGKIIAKAPVDKEWVLTGKFQPLTKYTPLMKWNYYPVLGIELILFILFGLISKKKNNN